MNRYYRVLPCAGAEYWWHNDPCRFQRFPEPIVEQLSLERNHFGNWKGYCLGCGADWNLYDRWVRPLSGHESLALRAQQASPTEPG